LRRPRPPRRPRRPPRGKMETLTISSRARIRGPRRRAPPSRPRGDGEQGRRGGVRRRRVEGGAEGEAADWRCGRVWVQARCARGGRGERACGGVVFCFYMPRDQERWTRGQTHGRQTRSERHNNFFFCLTLDFPRFCLLARSHALFPLPK
jgi:hypothetical protein